MDARWAFPAGSGEKLERSFSTSVSFADSGDPRIADFGLVTLADPEGLFLASNVVPIASSDVADAIAEVIDPISAALTPEGLVALNLQSTKDQMSAAEIATEWLAANGF
ncbi:MAG: hypothetical protein NWQ78_00825 [Pontimonas sp.]|nr:hypothetical protein [Pontimonas sp.]MDP4972914.1 hypothetical protein [Pontimonas sp.]